MNNAAIIAKLSTNLIDRISFMMADLSMTYAEAKLAVKDSTCAGAATWAVVDAKFSA